jgi:hypothetical protein
VGHRLGVGIADRVELSYQHQWFDTGKAGARLGLGRGYTFEQDVFGAKLRLFGDVVADQDRPWPQVSVGLQHKRSANGDVVRAVGARDASGTDFYIAATKLLLGEGLLLNGTVRFTRANQFGLLGHGGDREDGYRAQFEGSAAWLLSRRFAVGGEFRTRPRQPAFRAGEPRLRPLRRVVRQPAPFGRPGLCRPGQDRRPGAAERRLPLAPGGVLNDAELPPLPRAGSGARGLRGPAAAERRGALQ